MSLSFELKRLGRHSLVYGLSGLVSRILAVLLLPLYTHYLTRVDYGAIETLLALTAVLVIVLRAGITSAFFRFYFDARTSAVAVALTVAGKLEHFPLLVAVALIAIYPLVLLPLGFYLPAERRRIRRIVPLFR